LKALPRCLPATSRNTREKLFQRIPRAGGMEHNETTKAR